MKNKNMGKISPSLMCVDFMKIKETLDIFEKKILTTCILI